MSKIKIYYFGNEFIQEDSLGVFVAKKLSKELKGIEFVHIKDTFQLMDVEINDSIIIDVADSIKKTEIIDASKIKTRNTNTAHDFDLGFYLNITGKKAKIIAIPKEYDFNLAVDEVNKILSKLLPN